MLPKLSTERTELIEEWDELLQDQFLAGNIKNVQPLDAAYLWKEAGGAVVALTLVYRPHQNVSSHRHTMWVYIDPDTSRVMPINRANLAFKPVNKEQVKTVEVCWHLDGAWVLVSDGAPTL